MRKTKTKRPRLKRLQTLKQDAVKIYCEEVYKINHQESMTVRFQRQGGLSLGALWEIVQGSVEVALSWNIPQVVMGSWTSIKFFFHFCIIQ